MKQCPSCKRELSSNLKHCPYDGRILEDAPAKDTLIGKLLDDKYRLDQKIGEGGMGTVYRATHVQMEHIVAVKILHPHLASDNVAMERFRREARAAAQIRHANAVAVTDFGVTRGDGIAYLVMEFLEGEVLGKKIDRKKRLSYGETFLVLDQACAAVQAAHSKGIIHRDLKPDNIWLVKSDGQSESVKVLDFGIAKLRSARDNANLTQKGMILGTPYYMSPEQGRGEELDPRSDVYSLGVILYQMLTGEVPFEAPTPMAVVVKHINEAPRALHELRADIPEPVERVVLRALAKKRESRQETATKLAQEFEAALSSAGIRHGPGADSTQPFSDAHSDSERASNVARLGTSEATRPFGAIGRESSDATVAIGRGRPRPLVAREGIRPSDSTVPAIGVATGAEAVADAGEDESEVQSHPHKKIWSHVIPALGGILILALVIAIVVRSKVDTRGGGTTVATAPANMALVRGGSFTMGTTDSDSDKKADSPPHTVTVNDFYLDKYEVTNEEYERFVRESPHDPPPDWPDGRLDPHKARLPVVNVSWFDASDYAAWVGKRLPSEEEWEYAARGTDGKLYPWGNEWSPDCSNSREDENKQPVAVGSYKLGVSWCGVYDLAGNVAEWIAGDFRPYEGSAAKPEPGNKIVRGGSYMSPKDRLVASRRYWDAPGQKWPYLGFRCAKDLPK